MYLSKKNTTNSVAGYVIINHESLVSLVKSNRIFFIVMMSMTLLISAIEAGPFAPPLKVVKNKILDANNAEVRLQGLAVFDADKWSDKSIVANWKNNWKVNVVRLVFRPERWYFKRIDSLTATVNSTDIQEAYLKKVDTFLDWCKEYQMYVVLDGYHESGNTGNVDFHWQYCKKVWPILANRYKNINHILWEVYNEPYGITWEAWVPKAQELVDLVRSCKPVVTACVVPGVQWAQDAFLDKVDMKREQIIYSFHPYPHVYGQPWTKAKWSQHFGYITENQTAPLFIGEWHAQKPEELTTYAPLLMSYLKDVDANWTHWGYFPGWGNNLVSNNLGEPEVRTEQGEWVYKYLNQNTPVQPAKQSAASGRTGRIHVTSTGFSCYFENVDDIRIRIFGTDGRLIFSRQEKQAQSGVYRMKLPVGEIANGNYLVEIKAGQINETLLIPVLR